MVEYLYTIAYSCPCVPINEIIIPIKFFNQLRTDQKDLLNKNLKLFNYYSHGICRLDYTCNVCRNSGH